MNLKFEISLLILGGIIRILGVGFNIYYFMVQDFDSILIKYLCGLFLIAPSGVFLLLTLIFTGFEFFRCNFTAGCFKLSLGLLITIGGPLGLPLFFYAGLLACSNSKTGDFHIIDLIARGTSLIESVFESLPQIILQIFNNLKISGWEDPLKIIPICFSVLGMIYTLYKLCYSLDKVQQYQSAVSMKIKPEMTEIKSSTDRGSRNSQIKLQSSNNEKDEVYNNPNEY